MINRIIDIADMPARLSIDNGLLVIKNGSEQAAKVPVSDVTALIVSDMRVSYTNSVLSRLSGNGAAVVICDERHQPAGMVLPLAGHATQTERLCMQASRGAPVKKQAWKQIVRAKIKAQGRLLRSIRGHDFGLSAMAGSVRSGDPDNYEARAARKYWPALFGKDFRRQREGGGANSRLNYGYAVLRALTARAICSAGLHPSLGTHHHNRYDAFCLASDLMEPYRPLVDACVVGMERERFEREELDRADKAALLSVFAGEHETDGQMWNFFSLVSRTAHSLVDLYSGEGRKLFYPKFSP